MIKRKALATIGISLAVGAGMLIMGHQSLLADVHSATYKTSKTCTMCHKAMSKAVVDGWTNSGHAKALQAAGDAGAIVASFDASSPIKKEQVAWVLGKGIRAQAYLDANLQVLPAEWSVKDKKWVPIAAADGGVQCLGCHTTGFDVATKKYAEAGVSCESCHGPGSEHLTGDKKSTIVVPSKLDKAKAAMVCGSCHSKGLSTDKVHPFPVGYRPGDDLTKLFVDAKPTGPGRNQQYSDMQGSKHGQMGMGCITCHDPHGNGQPDQLKKPINDLCLGCHAAKVKDMATHAPGAAAGATCATCHMPGGRHTFKTPGK